MTPLLEIEDLGVSFAGRPAVRGLDLRVRPGEIVGLVGQSGSGKSVTALAVARLLPPQAQALGRIRLDGRELTALSEAEMCAVRGREVALVFQEPMTALDPVQAIGRQVAETVRVHQRVSWRRAEAVAAEALARVGLPADRVSPRRYPHQLSGGQRQRVAIASAIALTPRLLIADEPTTALDVTTQAEVMALLQSLVRETGMGLLLISHDLALVAGIADCVAVMHEGEIVQTGTPAEVLAAPRHPYVRRLVEAARLAPAPPAAIDPAAEVVLAASGIVREHAPADGGLLRRARPIRAVDGISLELRRGESLGIVGESGSGKTTLLRTLLALDRPQAGTVRLAGAAFSHARAADQRRLRRRIQPVFQDPYGSFDPRWRVEQLLAEPLALLDKRPDTRERRRLVQEWLSRVGLSPADIDRPASAFSGGQRQRLAIARALIIAPDVVAFDEATSALDVSTRAEILALLAQLKRDLGLAYLVVSHDLAVIRAMTDRVLVMQAGRVVEQGPTADVFAAPRHPYTATLLAATPDLDRALLRTT